jgi:hypothetical protein
VEECGHIYERFQLQEELAKEIDTLQFTLNYTDCIINYKDVLLPYVTCRFRQNTPKVIYD